MILRPYQDAAVNSIPEYFHKHAGNPVIVLPTGTGKSLIPADFFKKALAIWQNQRFMLLSHVKEIIEQDVKTLYAHWPTAPLGVYSAGLKSRDIQMPIIFAGIASAIKNANAFGHRDLIFIDECHLVSPNETTMYIMFIKMLKLINPYLKVIGLSATPYRLGQGLITDGGLFTDICFDLSSYKEFNKLIDEGYLAPLITPGNLKTELDISNVGTNNGDYTKGELQKAVDKESITRAALEEISEHAHNRRAWLLFASGVEHSEHISEILNSMGISCAAIHSKMSSYERDRRVEAFKRGELRAVSNNNVLTTGFDHPPVDCIGVLRPTISPSLWVQMLGRGTRPCDMGKLIQLLGNNAFLYSREAKKNCLVMDFSGNTKRLGPINDPVLPRKKGKGTGDVPVKLCPQCGYYCHASVRICDNCQYEFEIQTKIVSNASIIPVLKTDLPIVERFNVTKIFYKEHIKAGNPMIKVIYQCGIQSFNEFVNIESSKEYVRHKAHEWWRQRHTSEPPSTTAEVLSFTPYLRIPKIIRVWVNKVYPEVLSYEF